MKHYPPIGEKEGKARQVEAMFDAIAPHYDLLNRVLSFGLDVTWRRRAVSLLKAERPERILDVATGTGDLAFEACRLKPDSVVAVDVSATMLERARAKAARRGLGQQIVFRRADAQDLPFEEGHFDAALIAFGVRNFENLQASLAEIRRVLVPGGRLVILEFGQPLRFPVKQIYAIYSHGLLPRIGTMLSRDKGAYRYLPDSIASFPSGDRFLDRMRSVGFEELACQPLSFGIVSIYSGLRPNVSASG